MIDFICLLFLCWCACVVSMVVAGFILRIFEEITGRERNEEFWKVYDRFLYKLSLGLINEPIP